ncbi:MAG TPA: peptidase M61, partial [bacterium]|nr:peptidase M61 [bacterium]
MNYRTLLWWVCISASVSAQQVNYEVRFPNIRHHEAEVTAVFSDISSPVLDIRMSRSSPGRYALHEFIKNVYSVRAEDGRGKKLDVTQNDPYGWQVSAHDGTVRFFYTVYGDHVDG